MLIIGANIGVPLHDLLYFIWYKYNYYNTIMSSTCSVHIFTTFIAHQLCIQEASIMHALCVYCTFIVHEWYVQ